MEPVVMHKVDVVEILLSGPTSLEIVDRIPKDPSRVDLVISLTSGVGGHVRLRTSMVEAFDLGFDNGFSLTLFEHERALQPALVAEVREIAEVYLLGNMRLSQTRSRLGLRRNVMSIQTSRHLYTMVKGAFGGSWETEQ